MRLQTDRLEIRPLPAAAAAALPDDRAGAARSIGADLHEDWPNADLLDVLPRQASAGPFGVWTIVERESRTVVGDAGFLGPPDAEAVVEVGYGVVPSHRRRGYATEAVGSLVAWALGRAEVRAVVAGCDAANEASIRVLERLGFDRTGTADGQIRWRRE